MKPKGTIARQLLKGSLLVSLGMGSVSFHVALADDPVMMVPANAGRSDMAEAQIQRDTSRTPLEQALVDSEDAQLDALYARQQHQLIWQDPARLNTLLRLIELADEEGLRSADYQPEVLKAESRQALARGASAEQRLRFDLRASATLLGLLGHVQRGRLVPSRVYPDWEIPVAPVDLDLDAIMQAISQGRVEQAMAQARPDSPDYRGLKQALDHYRRIAAQGGWPRLPEGGAALRVGDEQDEVIVLRQRLAAEGESERLSDDVQQYAEIAIESGVSSLYDAELLDVLRRFQRRHMLSDDGVVGPKTRRALNVTVEQRVASLRANLERARWIGEPLQKPHVEVDLAGQQLRYQREGGQDWEARVVVGRSGRQSPVLESAITHVTLNPTWTIPPTILREDVLPRVRRNVGYLASRGYEVVSPSGKRLDPYTINWSRPGNVMIRQPAGHSNPLGRMVLRFPNNHLVYLHDTPARGLFSRAQRALSSGCIRVEGVDELTQMLFADTGTGVNLTSRLASGRTRNVNLSREVPLVMHYWSARAREPGLASFRSDIYGRDAALTDALAKAAQPVW